MDCPAFCKVPAVVYQLRIRPKVMLYLSLICPPPVCSDIFIYGMQILLPAKQHAAMFALSVFTAFLLVLLSILLVNL